MYDKEDLLNKVQQARSAGIPDEFINQKLSEYGTTIQTLEQKPLTERLENNWLIGPLARYGGSALEATRQLALLADPEYRQASFGDVSRMTPEQRARVSEMSKPKFMSEKLLKRTREKPIETTAKNIAGVSAYLVPVGKTLPAALALGGTMGGLRAYSEEEATPETVAGGVAGGAIAGGLFWGAGKIWQKGKELLKGGGVKVGEKAAQDLIKASPKAYENAADAGYDLRKLVKKYNVRGTYDDLVGSIENPNSGVLQDGIRDAEAVIQANLKTIGKQKVDLTPVINQLNYKKAELLKIPGNEEAVGVLDDLINAVKSSFKGRTSGGQFAGGTSVSVEKALEMVRAANQAFGKAIVEDQKGAVITQGQKVIAQTLRHQLKNQFPEIGKALTQEHELILLQDVIQNAQYKGATLGLGLGKFDITRPLTAIEPLSKSPQVSSRMAQLQQGVPETPAGLQKGAFNISELPVIKQAVEGHNRTNYVNLFKEKTQLAKDFFNLTKAGGEKLSAPSIHSKNPLLKSSADDLVSYITQRLKDIDIEMTNLGFEPATGRLLGSLKTSAGLQPGFINVGEIAKKLAPSPQVKGAITGSIGPQIGGYIGSKLAGGAETTQPYTTTIPEPITTNVVPETPGGLSERGTRIKMAYLMYKYPKYASQIKTMYEMATGTGGTIKTKTEAQVARGSVYSIAQEALADLKSDPKIITGTLSRLEEAKAGGTLGYIFKGDPATLGFNRKISNLIASIAKARAGTSFTPNEEKMLNKYAPKVGDSRQMLEQKLSNLVNFYGTELQKESGYQILPENVQFTNQVPASPQELY